MNIGDTVQILPYTGYGNKYKGLFGKIERNPDGASVGVRVDNYVNKASQYGVFWFPKENLKLINKGDSMDMLSGYKVATIKFIDGSNTNNEYYYALYDNEIGVEDYVVVHTGHHGMAIAQVVNVENGNLERVTCGREVIDKIDMAKYNERKEKLAKIKELKNKMDAKVKELQTNAIYEMLAEKDPDLKEMLVEMKQLTNIKE